MPRIYIINPANDVVSYHSAEAYAPGDGHGWALIADLTIVTLAALIPSDWDIRIADEAVTPVRTSRSTCDGVRQTPSQMTANALELVSLAAPTSTRRHAMARAF